MIVLNLLDWKKGIDLIFVVLFVVFESFLVGSFVDLFGFVGISVFASEFLFWLACYVFQ